MCVMIGGWVDGWMDGCRCVSACLPAKLSLFFYCTEVAVYACRDGVLCVLGLSIFPMLYFI